MKFGRFSVLTLTYLVMFVFLLFLDGSVDPMAMARGKVPAGNMYVLARVISAEAKGEPYVGQVAVGAVIINRVESGRFPTTLSGVIYQPGAFESVSNGQINTAPSQASINAARDALNGWDPSNGALFFFNPSKNVTSKWIWSRPIIKKIGQHLFLR